MKCYRLFILCVLISFNVNAQVGSVYPINGNKIENGTIHYVAIESQKSDLELLSYKNKKINDMMLVLEVLVKKTPRQFKVFVTDPPQQQKDSEDNKEVKKTRIEFVAKGFKYNFVPKNLEEELFSFEKKMKKKESNLSLYLGWLIGIVGLMFTIWITRKVVIKRRASREKEQKKRECFDKIKNAFTRKEIENLYKEREYIDRYCQLDSEKWGEFLNLVEQIQYKRDWTETEKKQALVLKEKVLKAGEVYGV